MPPHRHTHARSFYTKHIENTCLEVLPAQHGLAQDEAVALEDLDGADGDGRLGFVCVCVWGGGAEGWWADFHSPIVVVVDMEFLM